MVNIRLRYEPTAMSGGYDVRLLEKGEYVLISNRMDVPDVVLRMFARAISNGIVDFDISGNMIYNRGIIPRDILSVYDTIIQYKGADIRSFYYGLSHNIAIFESIGVPVKMDAINPWYKFGVAVQAMMDMNVSWNNIIARTERFVSDQRNKDK